MTVMEALTTKHRQVGFSLLLSCVFCRASRIVCWWNCDRMVM